MPRQHWTLTNQQFVQFKSCGLACEMYNANGEIYGWMLLRIKPQDIARTAMW